MPHKIKQTAEVATGTGAAGVTVTPTNLYPTETAEFLTNNFLWHISYSEWFKILAAAYVGMLIIKTLYGFGRWVRFRYREFEW